MKKAYLGLSISNRTNLGQEIEVLKRCLAKHEIELCVFVDIYHFKAGQEHEMMAQAFREIDQSDFLIVELTKKAIGVGVEVGYAHAKGKPVIYLKRKGAKYSTTVGGCAKYMIDYEGEKHLGREMEKLMSLQSTVEGNKTTED